jgi:hypothetical protein
VCNPIEGCFSVLKARVKKFLTMHREVLTIPPTHDDAGVPQTKLQWRMQMLERCATEPMPCITAKLVASMELHARDSVNAALRLADMEYGA